MKKSTKIKIWLLGKIIFIMFKLQIAMSKLKLVKKPDLSKPFIVACWHAHQVGLYGLKEVINRVNILISPSNDGQMITNACHDMGYKVIRGSRGRKGATQSVFQMWDALKAGDIVAIMIDGPKGPKEHVQPGIIELAKLSGVPIIPMVLYSPQKNYLKFNSWDEFRFPLGFIKIIDLFGEPIYVKNELTQDEFEQKRLEVETALKNLYADAIENFSEYFKNAK